MIADDMSVGKTMTAIAIIVKLRSMRKFFRKQPATPSAVPAGHAHSTPIPIANDVETDNISKLPTRFPESRRNLMWLPVLVVVPAHLLGNWFIT
jgi:SNF2 family DNA or RNA helicase